MKNLLIAWLFLLFGGLWLIFVDMVYQTLLEINGVPVFSTIGAALFLLALTSMLSWVFKEAWEERTESKAAFLNSGEGPAKSNPPDN